MPGQLGIVWVLRLVYERWGRPEATGGESDCCSSSDCVGQLEEGLVRKTRMKRFRASAVATIGIEASMFTDVGVYNEIDVYLDVSPLPKSSRSWTFATYEVSVWLLLSRQHLDASLGPQGPSGFNQPTRRLSQCYE